MPHRITAIVPTVGLSPWLVPCLEALRREDATLEIVLVAQGDAVDRAADGLASRTLRLERNVGFARANNLASAQSTGEFIATVNDDVIVQPGWRDALMDHLARTPAAAAAQGVNAMLDAPDLADGMGIAWNRHWQAVQICHGEPCPSPSGEPLEVLGVSATAAIYRREALERARTQGSEVFDETLFAYYEDVDLACRLRSRGYRAFAVPAARAQHAGSLSEQALPAGAAPLIYGNRYLVLARLLGRAFFPRLPGMGLRDMADVCRALRQGNRDHVRGVVAGWRRALRLLPQFAHAGRPAVPMAELRRLRLRVQPELSR